MQQEATIEESLEHKAKAWTSAFFDEEIRNEVEELLQQGGDALADAFYKDLEFGTGGMRGIMGAGTNRINKYTIGQATQGLSTYLTRQFEGEQIKVAIAHDCRHNSRKFAKLVADVFSANGIDVYLFEDLRPTPELSFAIRHLGCHSGVVLTASHNPPEYNGYKVYWNDGAQLVPPHDKNVINLVRETDFSNIQFEADEKRIHTIGEEIDKAYFKAIAEQSMGNAGKNDLSIVFTSIHGASIKSVPPALKEAGFSNIHIVEEQSEPNGDFPTVKSPNPEEPEALKMAIEKAEELNADVIVGTDPDGDRIGVGVRDSNGKMQLLNGNQAASLLTWYLIDQWKKADKLSGKEFIAETIVTSELPAVIARDYGVNTYYCLTGFKWIADIIRKKEGKETFIGGGEESYGYMIGDFVRDKDSASSSVIFCELAALAKSQGKTAFDFLIELYMKYGFYQEHLISIVKKGRNGEAEITQMMKNFRNNTPVEIDGSKVIQTRDFETQIETLENGETQPLDFPKSNVFQLITEDGTRVTARPSGTEPKIKFYFSVNQKLENKEDFTSVQSQLKSKIERIVEELGIS
ncbi:phospho-sugar mutase [Salibacter halophilus]|uniref:Phospho-sugar mutase n=1 Tax=Salibacter halophilus TaxID=1803916 RepID=A0A6N6M8R9_9FLAO|nr:phospho-sugar mutase [Salibacter halophilus]KAB1065265.1 phospho-sugar mutase [Salibacter halophilus]